MKKIKLKNNIFISILLLMFLIMFIYSGYHIIVYFINLKQTNNEINEINKQAIVEEVTNDENVEIIEQEEISNSNPYWDYIKMNLINVELKELKKTNNDVIGWIKVNGTNINYPFVQTTNNTYYLNHSFNKTYNASGWVFMDYRNNINNDEKNTILYAHSMKNKTMFGSLHNILKSDWLKNTDNYIIRLSTEYENTLWQVFSIYNIETTSDYLQTNFNNNDEYKNFLNKLINRSSFNFNTTVNENNRILTLSTCHKENEKTVVHAKLIKREKK